MDDDDYTTSFKVGRLRHMAKLDNRDPYKNYIAGKDAVKYIPGGRGNRLIITIPNGAEKNKHCREEICERHDGRGVKLSTDVGVKALGELLCERIREITGVRPFVVYFNIHRSQIDVDLAQPRSHNCGATNDCLGCYYWKMWHSCIEMAKEDVHKDGSRGLLLNLTGSTYKDMLVCLGYGLNEKEGWDDIGPSRKFLQESSVAKLLSAAGTYWEELIVDKKSFGGIILKHLHHVWAFHAARVVPSDKNHFPVGDYEKGGGTIRIHGSMGRNTSFDAIQIGNPACVRMRCENELHAVFLWTRRTYVSAVASAIVEFMEENYYE